MTASQAPTRNRPTRRAELDTVAHDHLLLVREKLGGLGVPPYASLTDILSALVLYTSPEQLAGMLRGYWGFIERLRLEGERS